MRIVLALVVGLRYPDSTMTQFTPLSEPFFDAQHIDPAAEVEPQVELLDQLLGAGWQVHGMHFRMQDQTVMVRETRVVLVNRALGRKLFGFGSDWEEAFMDAAAQVGR